jgi:hypothetical protein
LVLKRLFLARRSSETTDLRRLRSTNQRKEAIPPPAWAVTFERRRWVRLLKHSCCHGWQQGTWSGSTGSLSGTSNRTPDLSSSDAVVGTIRVIATRTRRRRLVSCRECVEGTLAQGYILQASDEDTLRSSPAGFPTLFPESAPGPKRTKTIRVAPDRAAS